MTLMKTIFWSLSRQTVFLQNLFNHIRLLFCGISGSSTNFFFKRILPLHVCSTFTIKSSFCTSISFFKVVKIKGEVFVALRASQGDLAPSRATISPQSPCSLTPETCTMMKYRETYDEVQGDFM